MARVELYVDGTLAATDRGVPYEAAWTTTAVPDGAHVLEARVVDDAGNVGRSASVRVLVDNGRGGPATATNATRRSLTLALGVPPSASASAARRR